MDDGFAFYTDICYHMCTTIIFFLFRKPHVIISVSDIFNYYPVKQLITDSIWPRLRPLEYYQHNRVNRIVITIGRSVYVL